MDNQNASQAGTNAQESLENALFGSSDENLDDPNLLKLVQLIGLEIQREVEPLRQELATLAGELLKIKSMSFESMY
jgi:hypothetical protein